MILRNDNTRPQQGAIPAGSGSYWDAFSPGAAAAGSALIYDPTQPQGLRWGSAGSSPLIYSQTNPVSASANGNTDLISTTGAKGSVLLAPGALNSAGRMMRVIGGGYYTSGSASGAPYVWIQLGTNVIASGGQAGSLGPAWCTSKTNYQWIFSIEIVTTSAGTSGSLNCVGSISATTMASIGGIMNATSAGNCTPQTPV